MMETEVWDEVKEGTAVYDPVTMTLYFHSRAEYSSWLNGDHGFRLVILWTKPAKAPNYR